MLKDINIRPVRPTDIALLEKLRREYWDADLELPKGYVSEGIETLVSEKHGKLICSATGTLAILIDPLIKDASASGVDLVSSIYSLERSLACLGQRSGAVDAYIAVPVQATAYHRIVEKAGYQQTCEHCLIFRRPLRPDTQPLLGAEREAQAAVVEQNTRRMTL